jgi:hypothetical protein
MQGVRKTATKETEVLGKGGKSMTTEIKKISLPEEAYNATREQYKATGRLDDFDATFRLKGSREGLKGEVMKDYAQDIEPIQKMLDDLNQKIYNDDYRNNKGEPVGVRLDPTALSNFSVGEQEHHRTALKSLGKSAKK